MTSLPSFREMTTVNAAMDCEGTGLDLFHTDMPFMCCMTFATVPSWLKKRYPFITKNQLCYEWPVDPKNRQTTYDLQDLYEIITLLSDPDIVWCFHNAKYDIRSIETAIKRFVGSTPCRKQDRDKWKVISDWNPLDLCDVCHDTTPMSHAFDNLGSHELKALSVRFQNIPEDDQYDLKQEVEALRLIVEPLGWKIAGPNTCPRVRQQPDGGWWVMDMWLPEAYAKYNPEYKSERRCATYCLRDTYRTVCLYQFYVQELKKEGLWEQYMENREQLRITYRMEDHGVPVNQPMILSEQQRFKEVAGRHLFSARRCVSRMMFNPNSSEQIATQLYFEFGVKPPRRSAKGGLTIDQKELKNYYKHYAQELLISGQKLENMVDLDEEDDEEQVIDYDEFPVVDQRKLLNLVTFLNDVMAYKKCMTAANTYLEGYRRALHQRPDG